jgi:DNA-binding transcriptional MerR regulator
LYFNAVVKSRSAFPYFQMTDTRYTIAELAREFDITPRAIRFYENQGLLTPAREGTNGVRRVYSARDRTRLRLTLRGKRLGFTLSEIGRLLDLYDSPTGTVAQLRAFLDTIAEHRAVLERQLEDLNATLAELATYETQGRALLLANAEKRVRKVASLPSLTQKTAKAV